MLKKVKTYPTLMKKCVNTDEYLRMIERVFNYRSYEDNKVRFT